MSEQHEVDIMPLVAVMSRLLAQEGGCPWDKAQTHQTLRKHVIEEACEVAEAIDEGSANHLCEELGDLLYQIVFHAALAERAGSFTLQDVIDGIANKMTRRHPHVFGETTVKDVSAVWQSWDRIKQEEAATPEPVLMKTMPPDLPALMKAQKFLSKAERIGCPLPITAFIEDHGVLSAELMRTVAKAHAATRDAEEELSKGIRASIERFQKMEIILHQCNKPLDALSSIEWREAWDVAGKTSEPAAD